MNCKNCNKPLNTNSALCCPTCKTALCPTCADIQGYSCPSCDGGLNNIN